MATEATLPEDSSLELVTWHGNHETNESDEIADSRLFSRDMTQPSYVPSPACLCFYGSEARIRGPAPAQVSAPTPGQVPLIFVPGLHRQKKLDPNCTK